MFGRRGFGVKNGNQPQLTLSVEQAGRRMGLGRGAAYAAVQRGEIPTIRIGRRILVPKAALEHWLAEARPKPAA
jgi:excisionase family DNA binding protein